MPLTTMRLRAAVEIGLLACLALALPVASAAAAPAFSDGDGLHVASVKQLDPRLLELSVTTAALPGPAKIRILLPSNYEAHMTRRYPVMYLFHGTSGAAADWTVKGEAEQTTAGSKAIVVMPDIGLNDDGGGYCTNWVTGTYSWETFHIAELIPWVDQNLRTIAARKGRAIAGLSQGGFCSLSYAARHPDLFSTALAYSGVPDIAYYPEDVAGVTPVTYATEVGLDSEPPNSMFGDRATNEINWAAHDPTTLANNLRAMNLFMYFGNGQPGPLEPSPEPAASSIEALVHEDNVHFHNRLTELNIPSLYYDYGPGTHAWPYWARDLKWSIGAVMEAFKHPPATPKRVTYTSADAQYSVFGWSVTMHRTAREFSTLDQAGERGFTLAGSGSGTVLTPPQFRPGASYRLTLSGAGGSSTTTTVADAEGRLSIEVPLGPPNPYQEDTAQAIAAGTVVYRTSVSITRT
jgi:S-formylglutathione hydrolase FrmB